MKPLAIITAVPFETAQIQAVMKGVRKSKIGNKTVYNGMLSSKKIIIIQAGIGKVNAAHAATCIIESFSVRCILNVGVGGAFPGSGLQVGDVAIASKEFYGDEGVAGPGGWKDMQKIGIPVVRERGKRYFNEFPLDKKLVKLAEKESGKVFLDQPKGIQVKTGNFVTVSTVSGTRTRAAKLQKRFGALCENMEGAAIAHVCTLYKMPLLEIRGMSNMVGVRDKNQWDVRHASKNCQKAVLRIISGLNRVC
jgi:futalosine hydrolase